MPGDFFTVHSGAIKAGKLQQACNTLKIAPEFHNVKHIGAWRQVSYCHARKGLRVHALASTPGLELIGVRELEIEGRFRRITTHQLCLAWWCHSAGHVTRRQLRVWFAAHEMAERRRYTARDNAPKPQRGKERQRKPLYTLDELKSLVGGRGSTTADADLAADLRQLAKVGLVSIEDHFIQFASSADQIRIDDLSGFWVMFNQIPNQARTVPVPRRTLRAMAGGFSYAVTGVMIALMIRSLFWHKQSDDYRIDGRTKGSWIAEVFNLSRRAVTDARTHLIELGWLESIEASQWELNRWGAHDRIHVEWSASDVQPANDDEAATKAVGEGSGAKTAEADIASPQAENQADSASPCLNSSSLPSEDFKTISSDPGSDPTGVYGPLPSIKEKTRAAKEGGRKRKGQGAASLRNIETVHLRDNTSLATLYYQAVSDGLIGDSEAGRLDFFALAERASARGNNPGGLFRWLLVNKRFDFITLADEDAAIERLRAMRQGSREEYDRQSRGVKPPSPPAETETDKMVQACLAVAEKRGIKDPFFILQKVQPTWTREQWDAAVEASELARYERLNHRHNQEFER